MRGSGAMSWSIASYSPASGRRVTAGTHGVGVLEKERRARVALSGSTISDLGQQPSREALAQAHPRDRCNWWAAGRAPGGQLQTPPLPPLFVAPTLVG